MTEIKKIIDKDEVRHQLYMLIHHLSEHRLLTDEVIKETIFLLATKAGSCENEMWSGGGGKKHNREVRRIILDALIENDKKLG